MKKINILMILAVAALAGLTACNKMNLEPKGMIDEGLLFNSEYGVKKYFTLLYSDMPIEDLTYKYAGDGKGYVNDRSAGWHTGNVWEPQKGYGSTIAAETTGRGNDDMGGQWGYWPYGRIRDVNVFINNFPNYADNFTEARYNELLAEARFIRAFYYFALAKRYGGVPIVDVAQDPAADIETLQLSRSTEYDTWMFIYDDLKFAMENGAKGRSADDLSRGTRWAAAALMAKAMLWAGSVAKYNQYTGITGPATDAGLMGMDPSEARQFFQYAYDACKMIADGGFSLHTGADKEKAYTEIFISDCSGDEDIFVKHLGDSKVVNWNSGLYSSYDSMTLPLGTGLAQNVGCAIQGVWEIVSMYEHPAIATENPDGTHSPIYFDRLEDFWDTPEMEPRCRANFFFSGMTEPASGTVIDLQSGVYKEFPGTCEDAAPEDSNGENEYHQAHRIRAAQPGTFQEIGGVRYKINGAHGYATGTGDEGYIYTGIGVRKYTNFNAPAEQRALHTSQQGWKVFRYGEILADWAEAAYELGLETGNDALKAEAFEHVNALRVRAGAHPHEMVQNPADIGTELYGFEVDENLQYIRDERKRELCIENQSEWDQRRWRIAHSIYENKWVHTLSGYYVISEGKYIYLNEANPHGRTLNFNKLNYYEPIPGGEINKNPNLVRNDGY